MMIDNSHSSDTSPLGAGLFILNDPQESVNLIHDKRPRIRIALRSLDRELCARMKSNAK